MRFRPLSWALLTVLVYAVGSNLDWVLRSSVAPAGTTVDALRSRLDDPRLRRHLRWAFLLGIPVLALLLRVPAPADIGLPTPGSEGARWQAPGDLSWPLDLAWTLALALTTAGLLVTAHAWEQSAHGRRSQLRAGRPAVQRLGPAALEALALEAHWALLRAGVLSLGLADRSLAVCLALGLIGLEAWSNPWLRDRSGDPAAMGRAAHRAALAILSCLVFLQTGSSLWALAGHLLVALGLLALQPAAWRDGLMAAPEATIPHRPSAARAEREPVEPTVV